MAASFREATPTAGKRCPQICRAKMVEIGAAGENNTFISFRYSSLGRGPNVPSNLESAMMKKLLMTCLAGGVVGMLGLLLLAQTGCLDAQGDSKPEAKAGDNEDKLGGGKDDEAKNDDVPNEGEDAKEGVDPKADKGKTGADKTGKPAAGKTVAAKPPTGQAAKAPDQGKVDDDGDGDVPDVPAPANIIQPGKLGALPFDKNKISGFLKAGGTVESEAAVQAALRWMAAHQDADGHWSLSDFAAHGKCNCGSKGSKNDLAATSLALLCFIAHGETHRGTEGTHAYTKQVEAGIKWLVKQQNSDGSFKGQEPLYCLGMAVMALCEDYNNSGCDPILEAPCRKAIKYVVWAQNPDLGGWRYRPRSSSDLSITCWQIQALKDGQLAGITPPRETLEKATKFLKSVSFPKGDGYHYRPTTKDERPSMVAAGLLCRQYLYGISGRKDFSSPELSKGYERLAQNPPSPRYHHMYYYYYATLVMFNIGGKPWEQWNTKMRELLIASQDKGKTAGYTHQRGSWDPAGNKHLAPGKRSGGRLMMTAMACLSLEVYYRYAPLNRSGLGILDKALNDKTEKK